MKWVGTSKDRIRTDAERRQAADAWSIRYGQEVDGLRQSDAKVRLHGSRVNFGKLNALKPGTPEFAARYIPEGESVIQRIERHGPEGFKMVKVDGVTGEPLGLPDEPLILEGPGPIV